MSVTARRPPPWTDGFWSSTLATMTPDTGFRVADEDRVARTLDRLARRIHAELGRGLRLVGVLRRGAPLARELARRLAELRDEDVEVGTLRLKRYADDLTVLHDEPELKREEPLPFEIEGAEILLVDDVVFTGRTLFKAVGHLTAAGARSVHVAVLCSRGPNEVPVYGRFVGMQLDVGEGNLLEVHAPPYEREWAVHVFHRAELQGVSGD